MQKSLQVLILLLSLMTIQAGVAFADKVETRFVLSRNDATIGGQIHVDVEMRISLGTSPRTLGALTIDVLTIDATEIDAPSGAHFTGIVLSPTIGYTRSVDKLSGKYRLLATGSGVNTDCFVPSTGPNGFDLTSSFQKIVTLIWEISGVGDVTWRFDQATLGAAYFQNLHNDPCSDMTDFETTAGADLTMTVTPVELSSFTAEATQAGVTLNWRTESETDNLGFNVYRGLDEGGTYEKINPSLIPGAGSSAEQHEYKIDDTKVEYSTTYYYKLEDIDNAGSSTLHGPISVTSPARPVPTEYALSQNFPNPFNPETRINYGIPEDGRVEITVFNLLGEHVSTLIAARQEAGYHSVVWRGTDHQGNLLSSGLYVIRMKAGSFIQHRKLALLR